MCAGIGFQTMEVAIAIGFLFVFALKNNMRNKLYEKYYWYYCCHEYDYKQKTK